uniref:Anoctamin transmembrane domain-containing protein n=1 Tax=Calcidiscus leptoporus TaxID=127549 RepID=A0A7S0IQ66_9EUKA
MVNWAVNWLCGRFELQRLLTTCRRPAPRKMATIGMWESAMRFQMHTNVVQVTLVAAFGTLTMDYYAGALGYPKTEGPNFVWEVHGEEVHVRVHIKIIVSLAVIFAELILIRLIVLALGDQDSSTILALGRDDYQERKKKARSLLHQTSDHESIATHRQGGVEP